MYRTTGTLRAPDHALTITPRVCYPQLTPLWAAHCVNHMLTVRGPSRHNSHFHSFSDGKSVWKSLIGTDALSSLQCETFFFFFFASEWHSVGTGIPAEKRQITTLGLSILTKMSFFFPSDEKWILKLLKIIVYCLWFGTQLMLRTADSSFSPHI